MEEPGQEKKLFAIGSPAVGGEWHVVAFEAEMAKAMRKSRKEVLTTGEKLAQSYERSEELGKAFGDKLTKNQIKFLTAILTLMSLAAIYELIKDKLKRANPHVYKAPGTKCLSFVEFLCSPKTVEKIFRPLIADWQYEIFEALKAKRIWKARWISLRYRWAFLMALGPSRLWAVVEKVAGIVKG